MKQVDAEVEEGAVIWKAVCFITLLSCRDDTTYEGKRAERGRKGKRRREREKKFECVK